jgi:hypothetical protein
MSTAVINSRSNIQEIPSIIYHENPSQTRTNRGYWELLYAPLEKIGTILRNNFYLPLYKNQTEQHLQIDNTLAQKVVDHLKGYTKNAPEELELIRTYFSVRDVRVCLNGETSGLVFTVRLFESNIAVNGKKFRVILFSFNENQEYQQYHTRKWEPLNLNELSKSPLLVLKAFQKNGVEVDSLITTSLGNVAFDDLSSEEELPLTLAINRGLTSIKKVSQRLFSFPLNYFLYGMAKLTRWNADPEQGLLNFLSQSHENPRQIIMIEAIKDYYFSESAGFASDYHKKLMDLGVRVFRASFYPFPFQIRSHHAISLAHLTNNCATKILANTANFSFQEDENVASLLAKEIFFSGNKELHTCFCISGNDATLNTATVRDTLPLLEAFVKEGLKMENDNFPNRLIG